MMATVLGRCIVAVPIMVMKFVDTVGEGGVDDVSVLNAVAIR